MRVPVHGAMIGEAEKQAGASVAAEGWYTYGKHCQEFERKLELFTGRRDAIVCNSGSSANLLALYAIGAPEFGERALKPGDEVITCAVGFPTTASPIIIYGAHPVFVDCSLPSLVPTLEQIQAAYTSRTRAVMLAHTLGMPLPADLRAWCETKGLLLIDDTCDALGSPHTCTGHLSTLSFFPAHQICAGEGGAVLTDNPLLAKIVRSLRDWGRDCWCEPGHDNTCGKRFDGVYDHKYTYSRIGFHLAMNEFQGAIGSAQMDRIDEFVSARAKNHAYLAMKLIAAGMEEYFFLPPNEYASWFGFTLICKPPIDRNALTRWLETQEIQTRLVFGGNLTRQPAFKRYHLLSERLSGADIVHDRAFFVGCWPGLEQAQLDHIVDSIVEYTRGIN